MYQALKKYIASGIIGGISAVSLMAIMAPRDGSGNMTLVSGNPVTTGTAISSTWANNTLSDIATALTNSLAKDGQTTPTANLPMGTFRHTNVGDASARNHYSTVNQLQDNEFNTASSVAGTNSITASLAPAITSYSAGMTVVLTPANNNTGATTVALNGLTALDAQKYDGDALASGDLVAGIPALFVLDTGGDDWILLNPQSANLSNGVAINDLARQNFSTQTLGSVSGTNTITGALTPAITSYSAGMVITFQPAGNNTGATTLAVNGLTALDVQKADGDALISGDLVSGIPAVLVLDTGADDWVLLNPQASINGIATTDFARLSQSNTFTQANTFTESVSSGASALTVSATTPGYVWRETGAAANNQYWRFLLSSEQLIYQVSNDAFSSHGNWLTVDRTGTTVDTINLQATSVQANGTAVSVQGHAHAATDITSGTLAIARGGTGNANGVARNISGKSGTTKTLLANASCPPTSSGEDGQIWYCY